MLGLGVTETGVWVVVTDQEWRIGRGDYAAVLFFVLELLVSMPATFLSLLLAREMCYIKPGK